MDGETVPKLPGSSHAMANEEMLAYNESNIKEFRSNGGKLSAFGDAPVVLLTTVGAKSGAERIAPLMYKPVEDDPNRIYVFASFAGAPSDPTWFTNAKAHPDKLVVEIGSERVPATFEILPEPKRSEVYAEQASSFPQFAEYEEKTDRVIPVVELTLERA
jgi:deazaflavin-dependent oxidoreductase (nitroreductase family)